MDVNSESPVLQKAFVSVFAVPDGTGAGFAASVAAVAVPVALDEMRVAAHSARRGFSLLLAHWVIPLCCSFSIGDQFGLFGHDHPFHRDGAAVRQVVPI